MAKELVLFTYTQPELGGEDFARDVKQHDDGTVKRVTLALAKRKDMAKSHNLVGKANATALNALILKTSDALKQASIGEFAKMAASEDWTGGRLTMTQSKNGVKRATMSMIGVVRESKTLTVEQVAAALAKMSDKEAGEVIGKAAELQKEAAKAISIAASTTAEASPATDVHSTTETASA